MENEDKKKEVRDGVFGLIDATKKAMQSAQNEIRASQFNDFSEVFDSLKDGKWKEPYVMRYILATWSDISIAEELYGLSVSGYTSWKQVETWDEVKEIVINITAFSEIENDFKKATSRSQDEDTIEETDEIQDEDEFFNEE